MWPLKRAGRIGATTTINSRSTDAEQSVRDLVGADGADWVFEAIGLKSTVELAYRLIRPGGTAVVVGQAAEGVTIEIDPFTMSDREKTIRGSSYGGGHPAAEFPRMADLLMAGRLDLDSLIARRTGLDSVNEAFNAMGSGEPGRTLLIY